LVKSDRPIIFRINDPCPVWDAASYGIPRYIVSDGGSYQPRKGKENSMRLSENYFDHLLFIGGETLSLIGCHSHAVLDIGGLTAYGLNGPLPQSVTGVGSCPFTTALGVQLEAMCDGLPKCYISNGLLQLTQDQCPGVTSVFVDVDCKPPGNGTSGRCRRDICQSTRPQVNTLELAGVGLGWCKNYD